MYRFYSSPINGCRITVVGEYAENGILNMSVACCNQDDTFRKRKGRMIAEGRFNSGKFMDSHKIDEKEFSAKSFVNAALELSTYVANTKTVVPGRTYQGTRK